MSRQEGPEGDSSGSLQDRKELCLTCVAHTEAMSFHGFGFVVVFES